MLGYDEKNWNSGASAFNMRILLLQLRSQIRQVNGWSLPDWARDGGKTCTAFNIWQPLFRRSICWGLGKVLTYALWLVLSTDVVTLGSCTAITFRQKILQCCTAIEKNPNTAPLSKRYMTKSAINISFKRKQFFPDRAILYCMSEFSWRVKIVRYAQKIAVSQILPIPMFFFVRVWHLHI